MSLDNRVTNHPFSGEAPLNTDSVVLKNGVSDEVSLQLHDFRGAYRGRADYHQFGSRSLGRA